MYAEIQPIPAFGGPATILYIDNVSVTPASSATLWWHLRTIPNGPDIVQTAAITLTGDAYSAWGNDDLYLYQHVASVIGISIINVVYDAG